MVCSKRRSAPSDFATFIRKVFVRLDVYAQAEAVEYFQLYLREEELHADGMKFLADFPMRTYYDDSDRFSNDFIREAAKLLQEEGGGGISAKQHQLQQQQFQRKEQEILEKHPHCRICYEPLTLDEFQFGCGHKYHRLCAVSLHEHGITGCAECLLSGSICDEADRGASHCGLLRASLLLTRAVKGSPKDAKTLLNRAGAVLHVLERRYPARGWPCRERGKACEIRWEECDGKSEIRDGALRCYTRAIEKDPSDARALTNAGMLLVERWRTERLLATAQVYLRRMRGGQDLDLAVVTEEGATEARAVVWTCDAGVVVSGKERACEHSNVALQTECISCGAERSDDLATAIAYLRQATADPSYAKAHTALGIGLQELSRRERAAPKKRQLLEDAAAAYRKALTFDVPNLHEEDAREGLSKVLHELGDLDGAIDQLLPVIQLHKGQTGALVATYSHQAALLFAEKGDGELALGLFKNSFGENGNDPKHIDILRESTIHWKKMVEAGKWPTPSRAVQDEMRNIHY
jgi:tetratricopeptide (TPR) repeat protein